MREGHQPPAARLRLLVKHREHRGGNLGAHDLRGFAGCEESPLAADVTPAALDSRYEPLQDASWRDAIPVGVRQGEDFVLGCSGGTLSHCARHPAVNRQERSVRVHLPSRVVVVDERVLVVVGGTVVGVVDEVVLVVIGSALMLVVVGRRLARGTAAAGHQAPLPNPAR